MNALIGSVIKWCEVCDDNRAHTRSGLVCLSCFTWKGQRS